MLKFSYYIDNKVDKAWFNSSNIVYGECDESDTQYKTVRIVFKNGSTYQYENVLVADWVTFKNAESQGKALNEHFKKAGYKYQRIDDANLNAIEEEYVERTGCNFIFKVNGNTNQLNIFDNKDNIIYSMEYPGEGVTRDIKGLLEKLNYVIKLD
jgi:hypothetical protein